MIKRLVKLTFREEAVPDFLQIFEDSKLTIRAFEGNLHLELLRDLNHPNVMFTLSIWENEAALDAYRRSDFFQVTWQKTKTLFAEKAEAWSVVLVD